MYTMKTILKTIRIIHLKTKLSVMTYLEYRASAFFYIVTSFIWSFASIFVQKFIFDQVDQIRGWTFGEMLLLTAIYNLSFAFLLMFFWNSIYWDFRTAVKKGGLDFVLTKPISARTIITTGRFDINGLLHIVPSITMLLLAQSIGSFHFSIGNAVLACLYFLIGQYALYSILFIIYATTFWITSIDHVSNAFWALQDKAKMPLEVYPKYLQLILLTLIPIGFAAYIPTKALLGELPQHFLIIAGLFTVTLSMINKFIWEKGIKRYESASS